MNNLDHAGHNYLCKLRILSKIPIEGKLIIINNDLNIYDGTFLSWASRKLYSDNKDTVVKYLTDLYRDIIIFTEQLMCSIHSEQSECKKIKKIVMLVSITEKLKESILGIHNLMNTYKDFLKTVSMLECIECDLINPHIALLVNFIPDEHKTEIIKR
jgi:hypothetical protein